MNHQIRHQTVSHRLKIYLHLTVLFLTESGIQCVPQTPWFDRTFSFDSYKPGCYNYQANVTALVSDETPNLVFCRIWCGTVNGSHVIGFTDGKTCSCYLHGDHLFKSNRSKSCCKLTYLGREDQRCGGHKTTYLTDPIYPELPNCFDGIRDHVNNPTLGSPAYVNNETQTRWSCQRSCSAMEYPFAAVWGKFKCWCSASFFALRLRPGGCTLRCPGNVDETCGGVSSFWVMKSNPVVDVTCLKDQRGLNYRGKVAVSSRFQLPCMRWSRVFESLEPEKSDQSFKFLRNWVNSYNKMNPWDRSTTYCRNIDNDENGPWCFVKSRSSGWSKAHCYIPICPSYVKESTTSEPCTSHLFGRDNLESKSTTSKGERCRAWSHLAVVVRLHETEIGIEGFNNMPIQVQRSNLCRNPDNRAKGPWCYIDDKFPSWEYCRVEHCKNEINSDCKVDVKGFGYDGEVHYARNGDECRIWASPEVQRHMATRESLVTSYTMWSRAVQLSNFCRNPDHEEGGPWCYVKSEDVPSWRTCEIKICHEASLGCKVDVKGTGYNGKINYASTGDVCRVWSSPEVQRHLSTKKHLMSSYNRWSGAVKLSNFCRNPDNEEDGPWCYVETQDVPSWRTCDIKICEDSEGTAAFGGVDHGNQLRPITRIPLYSLAGIIVYWKLQYA